MESGDQFPSFQHSLIPISKKKKNNNNNNQRSTTLKAREPARARACFELFVSIFEQLQRLKDLLLSKTNEMKKDKRLDEKEEEEENKYRNTDSKNKTETRFEDRGVLMATTSNYIEDLGQQGYENLDSLSLENWYNRQWLSFWS
ncbi:hypothetical protein F8388_019608 [Cannabis sativa]|uniref:Uncharacterized protein n=1 Tax=Cannabis sativa TaxID=3483 RepID=A0A7J6DU53_CANSA|nr:hypothetical protein F8388_019608 [Cannabis sativa]KAF4351577.1 hypothetical protein G4B88_000615 [Cannabis sativa]